MNFTDKIKQILIDFYNKELKANLSFFSKSSLLLAIEAASLAILNPFLNKLKGIIQKKLSSSSSSDKALSSISDFNNILDDDILNYVKNNSALQQLMNDVGTNVNQTTTTNINLTCDNPNYIQTQSEKLSQEIIKNNGDVNNGNNYIDKALAISDFDNETNNLNTNNLNDINVILPYIFLTCYLIIKIKDLLTTTDYPSTYRAHYLQRLTRFISAILKKQLNGVKNETGASKNIRKESNVGFKEIINQINPMLKTIDAIIIASLVASYIYTNNRKKYQSDSSISFAENTKIITCENQFTPPFNVNVNTDNSYLKNLNLVGFSCPINNEEPIVPHKPFELKNDLAIVEQCVITPENSSASILNLTATNPDLATKAIIENLSDDNFSLLIKIGQYIDSKIVLGTLGNTQIYSPIEGIITNIQDKKITIGDIRDPITSYIDELITKIQDLYKELNNTKFFIKDLFIDSQYPIMLNNSPLIDASINAEEYNRIIYFNGIWERFLLVQKDQQNAKTIYEKSISTITGKDNVKTKADSNQLSSIKSDMDSSETIYFNQLNILAKRGTAEATVTLPKESEFVLIEYYFNLYSEVLSFYDQNEIVTPFRDKINEILTNRYFIDGWGQSKLKDRINVLCNNLANGVLSPVDFYDEMLNKYNVSKNTDDVQNYVKSLGKNNTTTTENDKQNIVVKIMFIFNFVLNIIQKINEKFYVGLNKYQATTVEANFIKGYFDQLWKRFNEIPLELNDIFNILNNLADSPKTYSIIVINDEQYRYYAIGKKRICPIPIEENDDYTYPFSTYSYGDIEYWLKYCAFATLASVANPITGWATGLPPPIGPTPFPVVYIPIKAFSNTWGFIVIGISICGIYPYPWVLVSNLSTTYHVPFADPASVIEANVNTLKKSLSNNLKNFKQSILKNYLNNTKSDIDSINSQITSLELKQRNHRTLKPKENMPNYTYYLSKWVNDEASISEELLTLKTKRFSYETKYKIVYDAYSEGSPIKDNPDPKIKSIQQSEKANNIAFLQLQTLVNSIDQLLMPLPIATQPVSANFLFTLKNPKPIISIATNLDKNVDSAAIDKIINGFKLNNDDFSNPNFSNKSQNSIVNWSKYTNVLKLAMYTLVIGDPFPKYQNLKISNIPWILFLVKNWTPIGAQCFGIPGFPQFPLG